MWFDPKFDLEKGDTSSSRQKSIVGIRQHDKSDGGIVCGHLVQCIGTVHQPTNPVTTHSLRAGVRLNPAWLGFLYAGLSDYKTLLSSRPSDPPSGGERVERSHCASLRGIKEEPCDGDYLKQRSKGLLPITGRFHFMGIAIARSANAGKR